MEFTKKPIVLFTRKMNNVMGGLERQILEIGKILSDRGYLVYLITLDVDEISPFFDDYSPDIVKISLKLGNPDYPASLITKVKRQFAMRKVLREIQPTAGIAFMFGGFLMSRFAMYCAKSPLILAERNSPEMYKLTSVRRYRFLIYASMFFANKITLQFSSYVAKYPKFLQRRIRVIPNSILDIGLVSNNHSGKVRFVFAGRFSFQKQVIRLIEGFAIFIKSNPNATLTLFGEGEQELEIKEKIKDLQLPDSVRLLPPADFNLLVQEIDVLVLLSKWEGFPNIVAESLMAGKPVAGFSNCDGVSDLVLDGINGWLERDDGNSSEIVKLFERSHNGVERREIDPQAIRGSVQLYSKRNVAELWGKIMLEVSGE